MRFPTAIRRRSVRRGFTLMELLVATALLASLLAGLWGLIDVFTSLGRKGESQLVHIREADQLMWQLERDLRSIPDFQPSGRAVIWGSSQRLELWSIADAGLETMFAAGSLSDAAADQGAPLVHRTPQEAATEPGRSGVVRVRYEVLSDWQRSNSTSSANSASSLSLPAPKAWARRMASLRPEPA